MGWTIETPNQRNVEASWTWLGELPDCVGNSDILIIIAGSYRSRMPLLELIKFDSFFFLLQRLSSWSEFFFDFFWTEQSLQISDIATKEVTVSLKKNVNVIAVLVIFTGWFCLLDSMEQSDLCGWNSNVDVPNVSLRINTTTTSIPRLL